MTTGSFIAAGHAIWTSMLASGASMGWRPLLDPLPVHGLWPWLLLPLLMALALVYKAIKMPVLRHLYRQSALLAAQMLGLLVLAAAVLWVVSELL